MVLFCCSGFSLSVYDNFAGTSLLDHCITCFTFCLPSEQPGCVNYFCWEFCCNSVVMQCGRSRNRSAFFLLAFLLVLLETQMPVVYFHLLEPAGSQCIIKIYILSPVKAALLLLYVLL